MREVGTWLAGVVDLVLPGMCAGCDGVAVAEGAALVRSSLCPSCARALRAPAHPVRPDPCPPGLPPVWAIAAYAGSVRAMLIAHKEDGRLALSRPLGTAVAGAVAAVSVHTAGSTSGAEEPVLLVPVPSSSAARRRRGQDPTRRLATRAAARLRSPDLPPCCARVAPVLRQVRAVADQAGLGASERASNLAGALAVPRRLESLVGGRSVVVVDDVLTTGATLAEAARALKAAGADVAGAAVIAATRRRDR